MFYLLCRILNHAFTSNCSYCKLIYVFKHKLDKYEESVCIMFVNAIVINSNCRFVKTPFKQSLCVFSVLLAELYRYAYTGHCS